MGGSLSGIALKDLLEAGVHFGHQTKRWNPKMKQFIFGERNGIYIIDLGKTAKLFRDAEQFAMNLAAQGRTILFVGTKRQAQDAIAEEAQRCEMYFVNQRWLGGLLTNFTTIQRSLARLRDLEAMETDGRYDSLSKKEISQLEKEKKKLQKNLEGIRHMSRLPDALFVVDTRKEKIAVDEARKLENGLRSLRTEKAVAVLHYSPIPDTLEGEPIEIMQYLGSARLADAIDRFDNVRAVVHGHAHHGTYEGRTRAGIPVYNCAQFVLREKFGRPYALLEV